MSRNTTADEPLPTNADTCPTCHCARPCWCS